LPFKLGIGIEGLCAITVLGRREIGEPHLTNRSLKIDSPTNGMARFAMEIPPLKIIENLS
jgi:hypothetical protein